MPNPDGTYTKDEHRLAILVRYRQNLDDGLPDKVAMSVAGEQWRAEIEAEGERKIADVKRFLGVKS